MPKVFVLPDHIASQIAAGEVVERPSSVVKELVENAIDAGATQIEVAASANCRDIRIADNGCGMDAEDAVLAFQRHATSKIRSADDLWTLSSLGFRGEAVPSIASVSKITCLTRTRDSQTGSRIEAADGKVSCVETGCAVGTVMEVNDLFYNVPARLNFLKKASTEFAAIEETLQSLAIAHPEISFHLQNNGTTAFRTTGSGDLATVVVEAKLFSDKEKLCDLEYTDPRNGITIKGKLAKPLHFRGDRKGIMAIVNRRSVRCHLTLKALDYAYSDLIPRGRYPLAVVAIEIQPQLVDVNIHPTKKEIKYSNGNEVYIALQRALVQALREDREQAYQRERELTQSQYAQANSTQFEPGSGGATESNQQISFKDRLDYVVPALRKSFHSFTAPNEFAETAAALSVVAETAEQLALSSNFEPGNLDTKSSFDIKSSLDTESSFDTRSSFESPISSDLDKHLLRATGLVAERDAGSAQLPQGWQIVGYIHNTYIIVETPEGMAIVEQHIAHERTLYERLLAQQTIAGRIADAGQRLIVSAPLNLSTEQISVLKQSESVLQKLGFEFDFVSDTEVVCSELPIEMAGKDYATIVQDLLEQIAVADAAEIELEATKSVACQSAIKNGMPLGEGAIVKLLSDWHATPRRDTCPHGRPVCLEFSMDKLFQMFHPM